MKKNDINVILSSIPNAYPNYLVGEDSNWETFMHEIEVFDQTKDIYAGTIQGIAGNGKTHFIKYAKGKLKDKYNVFIIEDMFSQSKFTDALKSIYKSLINNINDDSLSIENIVKRLQVIEREINKVKEDIQKKSQTETQMSMFDELYDKLSSLEALKNYPSKILNILRKNINDKDKLPTLIKFFSGETITNNAEIKILRELNLPRSIIENENQFVEYFIDYIEVVYAITNKPCLIFMDEADRSIASESKQLLPKVGFQILDSLREIFNKLRTPTFLTVGTTTQAWKQIQNSVYAFARRFNRFHIILKEGKSTDDIKNFIRFRCEERNINYEDFIRTNNLTDDLILKISVSSNTWQDAINSLKDIASGKGISTKMPSKKARRELSYEELKSEILSTLFNFRIQTATGLIQNNANLQKIYPNSQSLPSSVLNNLYKEGVIDRFKKSKSSPYSYKITPTGDEFITKLKS